MKKGLVLVVMCVAMLFAAAPSASAQAPSDEYKATLEKMLELSGSMASAKAMVPQMISMLKQQSSASLDDLKKIVAFYESPVGKKLGASTPAMMAEGMQIGQKLGMEIATELQQELQAQGK